MDNISLSEALIRKVAIDSQGLPFPYFVKGLKAIGIDNYFVKVSTHKTTYTATNGEKLILAPNVVATEPTESFDLEGIKTAIRRSQDKEIDYPQFLVEIGKAGIHTYVVDISGMKVIYQGPNSEYEYEEYIPDV